MYSKPVIDAHIHLTEDGGWISDGYDASYQRLAEEMEQSSVKTGIILSLSSLDQNRFIGRICEQSNGKLYALAGFNPLKGDIKALQEAMSQKNIFKGIKLHPRMGNFSPMDEKLFPLYEEASDKGWAINFDSLGHSEKLPLEEIRPISFDKVAKKFPNLKMVLSHCGVPWIMEAFFVAKSNKNLYLDCSFIVDKYKESSIHTDLVYTAKNLDRKLIYGSDFPERSINRYLSLTRSSFKNLTREKSENIFSNNAVSVFNLNVD